MQILDTNSRAGRQAAEAAFVAFVLIALSYGIHGMAAEGCSLLQKTSWIALEVLRPVVLAAWQSISAHLCQGSWILQHVLHIVASIRPLLCVVGGLVQ